MFIAASIEVLVGNPDDWLPKSHNPWVGRQKIGKYSVDGYSVESLLTLLTS